MPGFRRNRFFILVAILALATSSSQLVAVEPDENAQAFGGPENEARIRKVIHDTVAVSPRKIVPTKQAAELLRWSEPVGGLRARIISANWGPYAGFVVLVELMNVSDKPLAAPTGNWLKDRDDNPFQVLSQTWDGEWTPIPWMTERPVAVEHQNSKSDVENSGNRIVRPVVELQPNESCLAFLCGNDSSNKNSFKQIQDADQFKVVLRQANLPRATDWRGELESPAFPANLVGGELDSAAGSMRCPAFLPELSHTRQMIFNAPLTGLTEVFSLRVANRDLLDAVRIYEPKELGATFEKRILAEDDQPLKLLLAAYAAAAGSEKGAIFLMESMRSTRYLDLANAFEALWNVGYARQKDLPDWVVELAHAALTDRRPIDQRGRKFFADGPAKSIAEFADDEGHVVSLLGTAKSRKSVSLLIELVQGDRHSRPAIQALGEIGDARAIPVLLDALERSDKSAVQVEPTSEHKDFFDPLHALVRLRAKEAVPVLLQYVESPDVIKALGEIGDPRALPAIRKLVEAEGQVVKDGNRVTPNVDQDRWYAARMAEAMFSADNTEALSSLFRDQSLNEYQRSAAANELARRKDPRAIAELVLAIKNDPSEDVVRSSINDLSAFKYKAAVDGLIDCFDVDFSGKAKHFNKEGSEPEVYLRHIAGSLRLLTGASIGPNKDQWQAWWKEHRATSNLK